MEGTKKALRKGTRKRSGPLEGLCWEGNQKGARKFRRASVRRVKKRRRDVQAKRKAGDQKEEDRPGRTSCST